MWYGSTVTWDAGNNEMIHVINHAKSDEGDIWRRDGLAVPYEMGLRRHFPGRPQSGNHDGRLEMWFSYRSGAGHPLSHRTCKRREWRMAAIVGDSGIDVSEQGGTPR